MVRGLVIFAEGHTIYGAHINPSMLLLGMEEFWVYSKLNHT